MAAKKVAAIPASPPVPDSVVLGEVLRVVRNSVDPLTAKEIAKLLVAPYKISEAKLESILSEVITAGDLFAIPPLKSTGKPRYWGRDFLAIARAAVLDAFKLSDGPLTAKDLAAQITGPIKYAEGDLSPILAELNAAGELREYPPAKAKGLPRYWNRDLSALALDGILEVLSTSEKPLTAKELAKQMTSSVKFTDADLSPNLAEAVSAGRLHLFPGATAKGLPRYWDRDLLHVARIAIDQTLNTKGPQTQANLKKLAKGLSAEQFESLFQCMLDKGALRLHPPLSASKPSLFGNRAPALEPYLKEVGNQLTKVVATLRSAQVPNDELRRALVQLLESAGITFGGSSNPVATAHSGRDNANNIDLIELMKRLEPGAERGALVGARELRRAAQLEKSQFDSAVLELARQGKLSLHRHDYATSLSQSERDDLVTDGGGTFYVGMALRRNEGSLT